MKSVIFQSMILLFVLTLFAPSLHAAEQGDVGYKPAQVNLEAREWFQDAKFGLFVHWGIFPVFEEAYTIRPWDVHFKNIPIDEYKKVMPLFNPVLYDPDAWCRMAKDAGMRYITITSKQHDGFCLFDSKVTDYDVVDGTPYGRDLFKTLADACKRHGLKLFFYYSQLDWSHPDYYPLGIRSHDGGRRAGGDWYKYLDFMDAQLTELCTNYGKIGGIWFDGMWDKIDGDWRLGTTYRLIHALQPQALIGSNHHIKPVPGEDFQMFEKGLPGKDPFSEENFISPLPLETCETINNAWNYNEKDKNFKSVKDLIRYLVQAAGNNSNFLLDVGPKPDGTIQVEFKERLAAIGKWLRSHGESIYGTRGGPLPPQGWGVTTRRKDVVYLHVLSESDPVIAVSGLGNKIKSAALLDGTVVEFANTELGAIVKVPEKDRDPYDTVIALRFD